MCLSQTRVTRALKGIVGQSDMVMMVRVNGGLYRQIDCKLFAVVLSNFVVVLRLFVHVCQPQKS
jgi:hypothetical protein